MLLNRLDDIKQNSSFLLYDLERTCFEKNTCFVAQGVSSLLHIRQKYSKRVVLTRDSVMQRILFFLVSDVLWLKLVLLCSV